MSRKHADLERELIDDLVPRTGRTLADWMAAIDAAGLADKNAIIDWLRPQGLTFAHASWLERIHNNGGKPIYLGTDGQVGSAGAGVALPPAGGPGPAVQPSPRTAATSGSGAASPRPAMTQGAASLDALLARGKGLRPLADMVLREIAAALPGALASPAGDLVSIGRPVELAVLLIGPRELRLGLDLGDAPFEANLVRARIPGAGAGITHMLVLADARQVAAAIELVRRADERVNGR